MQRKLNQLCVYYSSTWTNYFGEICDAAECNQVRVFSFNKIQMKGFNLSTFRKFWWPLCWTPLTLIIIFCGNFPARLLAFNEIHVFCAPSMEDSCSVSSPRRILSISKKRWASVSFHDRDDKAFRLGYPGEHGPKTSEVYGFVGSITTVVATGAVWFYKFPFLG